MLERGQAAPPPPAGVGSETTQPAQTDPALVSPLKCSLTVLRNNLLYSMQFSML